MFKGLQGKSAIVTGGATLIGAGVVRALHAAGVRVVIADIDADKGQPLADALGEGAHFRRTDITDDAQVAACVSDAAARHGGVQFLVNLACSYLDEGFKSPRASASLYMVSMRLTASSAMGEISSATFLPLRAMALMSASSKNFRRAWLQHRALRTGAGLRAAS